MYGHADGSVLGWSGEDQKRRPSSIIVIIDSFDNDTVPCHRSFAALSHHTFFSITPYHLNMLLSPTNTSAVNRALPTVHYAFAHAYHRRGKL